ncbi:chromosome segregation ATPase [Azospirillum fermentarium]|uniref:hypothetical protein n=1 Tax=Azospirillum fermentarium TaxID=1233114 RepID=UPI002226C775|nr:hypothetical protein [Azospirillum fermentarium]MCW2248557.1 chromosome segregation ATPase [Azospirillum fermentarium]
MTVKRHGTPTLAVLLTAVLLQGGCVQTYLNQKADLASGGPQNRVAAAQQRLDRAQQQQTDLNDEKLGLDRDIDRTNRMLGAAEKDLAKVRRDLETARRQNRIEESAYRKMRQEAESLQREAADLDFQVRTARSGNPAELAAKEQELQALQRKKNELEQALKLAYTN